MHGRIDLRLRQALILAFSSFSDETCTKIEPFLIEYWLVRFHNPGSGVIFPTNSGSISRVLSSSAF